ncbi:MAG: C40 family peptidase [Flavobacteriaceae bacterium]|nr:C40 family peptidase [Flavobacteriaceae bacterium]
MEFGICNLNSIAIRKEPNATSEMVSQILFGETFKVTDSNNQWVKVILDFYFYEGWVSKNEIILLQEDDYNEIFTKNKTVSNELVTYISDQKNSLQILTLGASLPHFKKNKFKLLEQQFDFDGNTNSNKLTKANLVNTTYMYLNTPFLWGGRTPFGIDCSGFTQMVYKINGYSLLKNASSQASQGEVLSFIEESEPGDLAFFDNEEGEIVHVGIILADNHIIHCHGKVRIDRLDQSGIYNADTKRHTHKLRVMKQIF